MTFWTLLIICNYVNLKMINDDSSWFNGERLLKWTLEVGLQAILSICKEVVKIQKLIMQLIFTNLIQMFYLSSTIKNYWSIHHINCIIISIYNISICLFILFQNDVTVQYFNEVNYLYPRPFCNIGDARDTACNNIHSWHTSVRHDIVCVSA